MLPSQHKSWPSQLCVWGQQCPPRGVHHWGTGGVRALPMWCLPLDPPCSMPSSQLPSRSSSRIIPEAICSTVRPGLRSQDPLQDWSVSLVLGNALPVKFDACSAKGSCYFYHIHSQGHKRIYPSNSTYVALPHRNTFPEWKTGGAALRPQKRKVATGVPQHHYSSLLEQRWYSSAGKPKTCPGCACFCAGEAWQMRLLWK